MTLYADSLIVLATIAVWVAILHGHAAWRRRDAVQSSFALLAAAVAAECVVRLCFLAQTSLPGLLLVDRFAWAGEIAECWLLTVFVDRFTGAGARRFLVGAGLALLALLLALLVLPHGFFAAAPRAALVVHLPWGESMPSIDAAYGAGYWALMAVAAACLARSMLSAWSAWWRTGQRRQLILLASLGAICIAVLCNIVADALGVDFVPVAEHGLVVLAAVMGVVLTDQALRAAHLEERMRRVERLTALGQLASGVAHDFGNILAGIVGCADLLALRLQRHPEQAELLRTLEECGRRGQLLVNQLNAFAHGRMLAGERIDVHAVVREVAALLRTGRGRTIAIELRLLAPDSHIDGDPARVHSLVLNLLVNARDAALATHGTVVVESGLGVPAADETLRHRPREGPLLWLAVRDTGPGIAPAVLPRIFDPYFTTKGEAGTGLGLSQVDEALRLLGGAVAVTSQPGAGACFRVWLPVAEDSSATRPAPGTPVLVAIDDATLRQLVCEMLHALGYAPVTSIGAAPSARIAAMVVDRGPAGDGQSELPDVPKVLLGTDGPPAGDGVVVAKPVEPRDLAIALRRAIGNRAATRSGRRAGGAG